MIFGDKLFRLPREYISYVLCHATMLNNYNYINVRVGLHACSLRGKFFPVNDWQDKCDDAKPPTAKGFDPRRIVKWTAPFNDVS